MSDLSYPDPGERDGEPEEVAAAAAADLADAASVYGAHALAAVRQARSGYLTRRLNQDPTLTPGALAEQWDGSREAAYCVAVMKAARVGKQAAEHLRDTLQSGQKPSQNHA